MGILDTIIQTKQQDSFQKFKPTDIVKDVLAILKEREKKILIQRYGLSGNEVQTLAAIGQEQNLTRERVRQIEKDLLKNLRKSGLNSSSFISAKDLIIGIVNEHGRIMAEDNLLTYLGIDKEEDRNSIIFLLHLIEELENYVHNNYKKCWASVVFNKTNLELFSDQSKKIMSAFSSPIHSQEFLDLFKKSEFYREHETELNDKVILNFLDLVSDVEKNVFGEWGLKAWKEISPKDVGDKAYLVMKNHGKPEHYSVITEMINKAKFDKRTAYKETVHNELIKDNRFILIGRGIYALSEWGFKAGVVADVITEVLKAVSHPLSREEIISEVLKRRMVKRNTILVGLSNKNLFKKVGKNLYDLAS